MKIIDFHTHVYPEKIAQKATENVINFYDLKEGLGDKIGTSEVLIKYGKTTGIENFVILPVALKAGTVRHVNEAALHELQNHKELYSFGTVHVDMENILDEVEFIKNSGLKGVKIHPDTQMFNMDDERLFPMYDLLQDIDLPMMIHCGDPRYDYSHPRRLKRILDEFPRLTVIGAHLGGWMLFDEAMALLKDTDCFVDICSSHMFMPEGKIIEYINGYGADRVLFGSDFPLWDPCKEAEYFMELDIPYVDKEKIAYKNALNLLKEN